MSELPRRKAILSGLQILSAATLLPWAVGRARAAGACVKADSVSMRAALEYTDPAPDPAQACINCGFFTMDQAPCGTCMIMKGPVSSTGHCHSWSDKND
jgi:High potential iron-sulfur protein